MVELGLLKEMKADATLPGGEKLSVDGFQVVDEDKLRELRGDELRKMNQNGMLALIFAHLFSLGQIRDIFARQVQQGRGPIPGPQAKPEPAPAEA